MWLNLRLHKHADRRSAWLGGLLQILWAATGVWLQICGHICEDKVCLKLSCQQHRATRSGWVCACTCMRPRDQPAWWSTSGLEGSHQQYVGHQTSMTLAPASGLAQACCRL